MCHEECINAHMLVSQGGEKRGNKEGREVHEKETLMPRKKSLLVFKSFVPATVSESEKIKVFEKCDYYNS